MGGKDLFDSGKAAEVHNRVAREVVATILKEPIVAGGTVADVMIVLESVLVGVVVECFKLGHDGKMIDVVFKGAKARLAKLRLENVETKGNG